MFCFISSNFFYLHFLCDHQNLPRLPILPLVAKFACANLAEKFCGVNLLNV